MTSLDAIELADGGYIETHSGAATLAVEISAGTFVYHGDADEGAASLVNRGGGVQWNGSGTCAALTQKSGSFDSTKNQVSSQTFTTTTIYSGSFRAARNTVFMSSLSMPTAEASTPQPT